MDVGKLSGVEIKCNLENYLRETIDALFNDEEFAKHLIHGYYPRLNILETEDGMEIEGTVPGLTLNDLSITWSSNLLAIRGNSQNNKDENKSLFRTREIYKSSFTRTIPISSIEYDIEKITASVQNGLLKINIPYISKKTNIRIIKLNGGLNG